MKRYTERHVRVYNRNVMRIAINRRWVVRGAGILGGLALLSGVFYPHTKFTEIDLPTSYHV